MYEYIFSYCENNNYCIIRKVIPKDDSPVISGKTTWKIKNNSKTDKLSIKIQSLSDSSAYYRKSIFKKNHSKKFKIFRRKINGLP